MLRRRRTPPPLTRPAARLGMDRRRLRPVSGRRARLELLRADPPRDAALPLARGRRLSGRLRLLPGGRDQAGGGRAAPPIRLRAAHRHRARHAHGGCARLRVPPQTAVRPGRQRPIAAHEPRVVRGRHRRAVADPGGVAAPHPRPPGRGGRGDRARGPLRHERPVRRASRRS